MIEWFSFTFSFSSRSYERDFFTCHPLESSCIYWFHTLVRSLLFEELPKVGNETTRFVDSEKRDRRPRAGSRGMKTSGGNTRRADYLTEFTGSAWPPCVASGLALSLAERLFYKCSPPARRTPNTTAKFEYNELFWIFIGARCVRNDARPPRILAAIKR